MEREQMIGKQSILFHNAVHILSGASMVGKKEGDGPLGKYFDKIGEEDGMFGCQSWEEAESILQKEAVSMAIKKSGTLQGRNPYDLCRRPAGTDDCLFLWNYWI